MCRQFPVRLHISLNARLFKIFNLKEHCSFTIAHLKQVLGTSFHIPGNQIQFTLVSGRFTRDEDALYELRASDGNLASLDVGLPPAYAYSSLSNGIISVQYYPNTSLLVPPSASLNGIHEVPAVVPSAPFPIEAGPSRISVPLVTSLHDLSREQRIALRAQLEDPFSIASKSCFEDDSDEEDDYGDVVSELGSDVDDDLYSDDGEEADASSTVASECSSAPTSPMSSPVEPSISSRFWPSDPTKLTPGHLRQLVCIVPAREPRREIPLRSAHLRYKFQCRIFQRLQELSFLPSENVAAPLKLLQDNPSPQVQCASVDLLNPSMVKRPSAVEPVFGLPSSPRPNRNYPHLVVRNSSSEVPIVNESNTEQLGPALSIAPIIN